MPLQYDPSIPPARQICTRVFAIHSRDELKLAVIAEHHHGANRLTSYLVGIFAHVGEVLPALNTWRSYYLPMIAL